MPTLYLSSVEKSQYKTKGLVYCVDQVKDYIDKGCKKIMFTTLSTVTLAFPSYLLS